MKDRTPQEPPETAAPQFGPMRRTVISLLLFAHFFFVFVAISANFAPSELQSRILDRFAFYTRLFNFDLNYTPYHLTHGPVEDADHRLEVLPDGKDADVPDQWVVLPDVGMRGSDRYHRYQRLAKVISYFADEDDVPAYLAQAAASSFVHQRDIRPSRIRCRRHAPRPRNVVVGGTASQRDPDDASYFQVTYDAQCIVSPDGNVLVSKVSAASQVAQPTTENSLKDANNP